MKALFERRVNYVKTPSQLRGGSGNDLFPLDTHLGYFQEVRLAYYR